MKVNLWCNVIVVSEFFVVKVQESVGADEGYQFMSCGFRAWIWDDFREEMILR